MNVCLMAVNIAGNRENRIRQSNLQKMGANNCNEDRINHLADGIGLYTAGHVSARDVQIAKLVQTEQRGRDFRGDVEQITNFGNNKR